MSQPRIHSCLSPIPALMLALLAQPGLADPEAPGANARAAVSPDPGADSAPRTSAANPGPEQGAAPPALMLAQVYEPGIAVSDFWVSEKLDGVRAYWDGGRLVTRRGHEIHAPAWFVTGFPAEPLDGELWLGRGRFEELSGTVRRLEPDDDAWRAVRYLVFDLPGRAQPFGERLALLDGLVRSANNPSLASVEQFRLPDHESLINRLAELAAQGGEGLMLHRDGSPYRGARSPDLLKVKPYQDAEARVIGHVPGKGKYLGMLGALEVEDESGRRFRIGTGFTDAQRRDPPPPGSRVTFKYRGLTGEGIPRFASFLRVDP
jgi:DNA ligase 1